jgi:hypothetical protein
MNTTYYACTKPHFRYTSTAEMPLTATPRIRVSSLQQPYSTSTLLCHGSPSEHSAKQAARHTFTNPQYPPEPSDACAWLAEIPPLVRPERAWCGGTTVPARNHQRGIVCRGSSSDILPSNIEPCYFTLCFALCVCVSSEACISGGLLLCLGVCSAAPFVSADALAVGSDLRNALRKEQRKLDTSMSSSPWNGSTCEPCSLSWCP